MLQLASNAQVKPVVSLYFYYTVRLPGMIPVDDNGNPFPVKPDTTLFIYAETTTKLINWENFWYSDRTYDVSSQRIIQVPYAAGSTKAERQNIILTTQKGNYLWQLSVAPSSRARKIPCAFKKNKILLSGKDNGKTFYEKAGNPVELYIVPSQ